MWFYIQFSVNTICIHTDIYIYMSIYIYIHIYIYILYIYNRATAAAKSLQSCPTLCDPIDGSPPGSPVPGILQARTLEWAAISFSKAWKWKVKVKSLSRPTLRGPHGLQPPRLLRPWDFPGKSTGVGCHCLLWYIILYIYTSYIYIYIFYIYRIHIVSSIELKIFLLKFSWFAVFF